MKRLLQTVAISALLLGPAAAAEAQISIGVRIGPPPAPRVYRVPRQPGPDYVWVQGYWFPERSNYKWHDGYWTRPPFAGAYWIDPYYDGGQYFGGRWEDGRRNLNHNHRWDRGRQRDERRGPRPNGRDNDRRR